MRRKVNQSRNERTRLAQLSRRASKLVKELRTIEAESDLLVDQLDRTEGVKLTKLAIPDSPETLKQLDASILEELQMLTEKFLSRRTPKNKEAILLELLRLLWKIVWKLFALQGMRPPPIDPRLVNHR